MAPPMQVELGDSPPLLRHGPEPFSDRLGRIHPSKNPFEFDGSVTHSTGTVRALPGGSGGLTSSSSRLGVILDS
jgi:hypothetical protein